MRISISQETPISFMLFGMMFIQIANPLQIESLVSAGTWMIFFASILAMAFVFYTKKADKYVFNALFLFFLVFLSLLVSFEWGYQSFVSAFCFLEIPFFMCCSRKDDRENIKKLIYYANFILSLYYAILSCTPLAYFSNYYSKYGIAFLNCVTLGYNNPNETAIYLFINIVILISIFIETKRIGFKCFLLVDIAYLSYLLLLTKSRAGMLIEIFVLILFVVCKKHEQFLSSVFKITFLMPVVFIILICAFPKFMGGIQVWGESFDTGREHIFWSVFDNLSLRKFLCGDYSFRFRNLHNGLVSIFGTIGIFGVILFYRFLYKKFEYILINCLNRDVNLFAFIGLLGVILWTSVEASPICAGSTFAASFVSVYLLCVDSGRKTNESLTN